MNPIQTVLELVEAIEKPTSYSSSMTLANGYFEQMYKNTWKTAFAQKDIQLVKFFEQMRMSDREKDLLYVSNFFNAAFTTLHVTILTLGEAPSPAAVIELKKTFEATQRLDAADILLNDRLSHYEFLNLLQDLGNDT